MSWLWGHGLRTFAIHLFSSVTLSYEVHACMRQFVSDRNCAPQKYDSNKPIHCPVIPVLCLAVTKAHERLHFRGARCAEK